MKNILYIDCFSGISGDMIIGAFLDLGLKKININFLKNELKKLNLDGYRIEKANVKSGSLLVTKFSVNVQTKQKARSFKDIKNLINVSSLDEKVKNLSINIFTEIARAESKIHGSPVDDVHFHEVGAVDSMIDIVSCAILYYCLDINLVYSRKIPLGRGTAPTIHGKIPIPAPATLEILRGIPVYGGDFDFEVTTPTGAAIIKVLVNNFNDIPAMSVKKIGMGAGNTEGKDSPNVLRLLYGSAPEETGPGIYKDIYKDSIFNFLDEQELIILSTNIDDSTPEIIGYLLDRLFKNKVLDAWVETILMKKNRPAFKVCALCKPENLADTLILIFSETSTFGVRVEEVKRFALKREIKRVKLPYGEVMVKVAILKGKEIIISPEYESCVSLAKKTGKPLQDIYHDAVFFLSSK
ncbi:MAG: nickel pincer cofactor biosynthesis protein LarC [Actinobacteria bacterium]|nr:nickel pincer cofactor biosynthesis protein LarC [Actinomycetota bacterium]